MSRYSIYTFSCTKVPSGSLEFTQLGSQGMSAGPVLSEIIPGGATHRGNVALGGANPSAQFTTRDLDTFFTTLSPTTVQRFTSGIMRHQVRAEGSTFESSTDHDTYDIATGVIQPGSIQASQQDTDGAELSFQILPLYDGTNKPFARTGSVDFSAVTAPAFASQFFMGPVYINSVQVPAIERVSVDFGINYQRKGFNGSPYPTTGSIITHQPVITFSSTDVGIDVALDLFSRALAGTIDIYFQRGVASSDRVAVGTATHLKISAATGQWGTDSYSVSRNDDGTVNFTVMPTAALASTLSSAIP